MKVISQRLTDGGTAELTAYLLDSSVELSNAARRPAVLIFPGGGYRICSNREAEPVAMTFAAAGFHTFVLRYTVGDGHRFEEPMSEAVAALRTIRDHAAEWAVIPDKIAVCGFSAGGHLAAALSTMGELRPDATVLGYPCILENISRILAFAVPDCAVAVDEKTPPAFLFHTADDSVVPVANSLEYALALSRINIPFELHVYPHGNHGLSVASSVTSSGRDEMVSPVVAGWVGECIRWLKALFSF